eukprot:c14826_g1_i2 orf=561-809(+)
MFAKFSHLTGCSKSTNNITLRTCHGQDFSIYKVRDPVARQSPTASFVHPSLCVTKTVFQEYFMNVPMRSSKQSKSGDPCGHS